MKSMKKVRQDQHWLGDLLKEVEHVSNGFLQKQHGWSMLSVDEMLHQLEKSSKTPPLSSLLCTVNKCKKEKNWSSALHLYNYLNKNSLHGHRLLGNTLLLILVEVGSMDNAQKVFEKLERRNESSWCTLITGHVRWGNAHVALLLYKRMQESGVCVIAPIFVALLKACTQLKDSQRGCELHDEISKNGMEGNMFIASSLIDMYSKFGMLAKAREVFDKLPTHDVILWNALISGYVDHADGEAALECFEQLQLGGLSPSPVTYLLTFKACSITRDIKKGQELHAETARKGLLQEKNGMANTLIDMYVSAGLLSKAQEVFDKIPMPDAATWNALITGYANHGFDEEVVKCFEHMQLHNISPDSITFAATLKACSGIGAAEKLQYLHWKITEKGLEQDMIIGGSLVNMYADCGLLASAQEVLDNLASRNKVSWTGLIAGYVKHRHAQEALNCLKHMQKEGMVPDSYTYVCCLNACSSIGAAGKGQDIHTEVLKAGLVGSNAFVGSALVNMYASCGLLVKAEEVFNKLLDKDVISWTALLAGYAQLGEWENVISVFDRMMGDGIQPTWVTFLLVLTAFSHGGLLDQSQVLFETMSNDFGITPTLVHWVCLLDLIGRAGQFDYVIAMTEKVPFQPTLVMWHTLLGACRKWGNVKLGRGAFDHAVELDEKDGGAYIGMFNIYQDAGMHEDARKIDVMRLERDVRIEPEHSWLTSLGRNEHSVFEWV